MDRWSETTTVASLIAKLLKQLERVQRKRKVAIHWVKGTRFVFHRVLNRLCNRTCWHRVQRTCRPACQSWCGRKQEGRGRKEAEGGISVNLFQRGHAHTLASPTPFISTSALPWSRNCSHFFRATTTPMSSTGSATQVMSRLYTAVE